MEGEFRRGVVHGRATYYLDNGTRYYKKDFKQEMMKKKFQVHGSVSKRSPTWAGRRYRGRRQSGDYEVVVILVLRGDRRLKFGCFLKKV